MKEYKIEIRVKNNLLQNAMIEEGYESAAELSRVSGVRQSDLGNMLALKLSLFCKNGEVRKPWLIISETLRRLPEDLIPARHHYETLKNNKAEIEASFEDIGYLLPPKDPEQLCIEHRMQDTILNALNELPERQKKVIEMRFGLNGREPMTLEQVGEVFKISGNRVRQIEAKALRDLKKPSVLRSLEQ